MHYHICGKVYTVLFIRCSEATRVHSNGTDKKVLVGACHKFRLQFLKINQPITIVNDSSSRVRPTSCYLV